MKRLIYILIAMTLHVSSHGQVVLTGKVHCEGVGLSQVSVSNGDTVVSTNIKGHYVLPSKNNAGTVFISIPSGYWVKSKGPIPVFSKRFSQASGKIEDQDFELQGLKDGPFHFFVSTDLHLTNTAKLNDISKFKNWFLPDLKKEIERRKGFSFALILGDMTTDVRWYGNEYALPEYVETMKDYPVPAFHVMGNHDNDPKGEAEMQAWDSLAQAPYIRTIGPNYYSFNVGRTHFLMLDNCIVLGPKGQGAKIGKNFFKYAVDEKQLNWIKQDLKTVPYDHTLVVALHVPIFSSSGLKDQQPIYGPRMENADALTALCDKYEKVHILSGHSHVTETMQITPKIIEHNMASLSAVSWMLYDFDRQVCPDGTPGGYQIFSVDKDQMRWEFKAVGKSVKQSQFRVYDLNKVPKEHGGKPGENKILINVINWDSQWKVEVFESNKAIEVQQIEGKDPLFSFIREKTESLPTRPTAFRAKNTIHLFEAKTLDNKSEITVKVTDRFGQVYEQKVSRPKAFAWDNE